MNRLVSKGTEKLYQQGSEAQILTEGSDTDCQPYGGSSTFFNVFVEFYFNEGPPQHSPNSTSFDLFH